MSWVTIICSMVASACLTLAAMHLFVWYKKPTEWANLCFCLTAVATAAVAGLELWLMRAETAQEFGVVLRWAHVPYWVLIISLVGFVRLYLRAGRLWLAYTICGVRTMSLVLNFVFTPNLNYREITALRHVRFLGESVSVAEGMSNPWMLVGQVSFLLLVVFVVDVMLTVWRRGDRRQARLLTSAIVFFVLAATGQIVGVLWQIIHTPLTPSLFFLGIVAAMAYEMSDDVHRAAQLADELREQEQQLQAILDGTPSLVYVKDLEGRLLLVNRRFESVFGLPRENLIGKTSHELLPKEIADAHRAADLEVIAKRAEIFIEEVNNEPEGRLTYLSVKFPLFDPVGKMYAVCGISTDITHHKQAEAEVLRQRNELAHVARLSTMGQLASSLAHELNQPLGAILRNAEAAELFLQHPSPDLEEVRAILADIRKDDQRAGQVIDRMRALMKRREVKHTLLDISELVDEVVPMVHSDAVSRRVRLDVEVPRNLPPVRGDRVHLQQVLLNLLLNGMDAMSEVPAEARRLMVRARQADARTIEVAVDDAGHGVPAEVFKRLFEPFFTTKPNGLCMGLPISSTIIAAHGGRMWAENSPAGATFYFTMPVSGEGQGARGE